MKPGQQNPRGPTEPPASKKPRANKEISAPEVRLVHLDGTHEVLPLAAALAAAKAAELDLVEVAGALPLAGSYAQ